MNSKQQSVKFVTLGCKVNQYETQAMAESLAVKNIKQVEGAPCDYVVVNTCTVTADADRNNRYWIRRMKRENPQARVVVTGCYVEKNRAELEAMPEIDLILSNYEKDKLHEKIFEGCATETVQKSPDKTRFAELAVSAPQGGGTRAFVKIQDGCNHSCAFCKVVLVRGRSRSRELKSIVEEVKRLAEGGYREVVFAGIQLGAYGLDYESPEHFRNPSARDHYFLTDVIEAAAEVKGIERIRLSSIEPIDIGEPLIQCFERVKKFCPQMHIPLQSGDTEILALMNRRYSGEFYRDLILKLRQRIPDFELTLDVMAGFPGEEARHFENTVKLLEEIQPLKCHVFPYSRREGTRAASMTDVAPHLIRERVQQLIGLSQQWSEARLRLYLGRELDVLVEKPREQNGFYEGMAANYVRVCFPASQKMDGQIVRVRCLAVENGIILGKLVPEEVKHG
ncbi:MAG TPA: tRNA (N(6)-L-threonylcarbamoyladenosine(37)-C(2))-methylthiotransferase MtaB [Candidatus Omnitrophica bacterium]|nr:tRNA (N(6)-L-threonylcarbamoyladenosine(37)-C(2))-methylthiotransferase MtaB [Candidatus Omnitrophota bacterium]